MQYLQFANMANPELIKALTASVFEVSRAELESPIRTNRLAIPRAVAMQIIRKNTRLSLPKIGKIFGNRDHSSVRSAVQKADKYCNQDETVLIARHAIQQNFEYLMQRKSA